MTGVLSVYSALFMRFAWMVKPRNYLLLTCHMSNATAQGVQLARRLTVDGWLPAGLVPAYVLGTLTTPAASAPAASVPAASAPAASAPAASAPAAPSPAH
jgi:hypothetical protein